MPADDCFPIASQNSLSMLQREINSIVQAGRTERTPTGNCKQGTGGHAFHQPTWILYWMGSSLSSTQANADVDAVCIVQYIYT